MLSSIRNFSKTIYAKVLLGIVIIPFVFWGMGSSLSGGNKNIVVQIDKTKYSTQDFASYIQSLGIQKQKIEPEEIELMLSNFIGDKLIENEFEYLKIKLSDSSLSKLIKNQKEFKKNNEFSRTEYEKFLVTNNLNSILFESSLAKREKKNQLLNFIGGGVLPSEFLVSSTYNKINQKRSIELIDLNDIFTKDFNFTEEQIKSFYEKNKEQFTELYKSVKVLELNSEKLTGNKNVSDLYFKKVDEIDNDIITGNKINDIIRKYNLGQETIYKINKSGLNINSETINELPENLKKNIFSLSIPEETILLESIDKFFVVEFIKEETVLKKINDKNIRNIIKSALENETKRKLMSEIIAKINQKKFNKSDFDKLSKEKNVLIKKILLNNKNDDKILKRELLDQIYSFQKKQVIVVNDLELKENFLIYIDKIENVIIDDKSAKYKKYLELSEVEITNELFTTYDNYLKQKYKIDINYKALNTVKNYFN